MKKLTALLLLLLFSLFGLGAPQLRAAESSSPYDTVLEGTKNTNSVIDGLIGGVKDVDKSTASKLTEYLLNSSMWKQLSEKAQNFVTTHIGKVGPWAKKLGWILNAIDLAPSVYNTFASFKARDKEKFKTSFRDVALKTSSIVVGLGIGWGVSAAIPLVVAGTAATGGGLLLIAAGGAVVSVAAGMYIDKKAKEWFTKPLEDFAGNLYDKLIGDDTISSLSGSGSGGGGSGKGGVVTLDKLQW